MHNYNNELQSKPPLENKGGLVKILLIPSALLGVTPVTFTVVVGLAGAGFTLLLFGVNPDLFLGAPMEVVDAAVSTANGYTRASLINVLKNSTPVELSQYHEWLSYAVNLATTNYNDCSNNIVISPEELVSCDEIYNAFIQNNANIKQKIEHLSSVLRDKTLSLSSDDKREMTFQLIDWRHCQISCESYNIGFKKYMALAGLEENQPNMHPTPAGLPPAGPGDYTSWALLAGVTFISVALYLFSRG